MAKAHPNQGDLHPSHDPSPNGSTGSFLPEASRSSGCIRPDYVHDAPILQEGILFMNIYGLYSQSNRTKVAKLRDMAIGMNAWAIVLTETWLSPKICDSEVSIEGFNLFRSDRDTRHNGGTCIYLKEELAAVSCLQYSNTVVEGLVLKVRELELIIFSIYRPPDCNKRENVFQDTLAKVRDSVEGIQSASDRFSNILGFGDFNFRDISWPKATMPNEKWG